MRVSDLQNRPLSRGPVSTLLAPHHAKNPQGDDYSVITVIQQGFE